MVDRARVLVLRGEMRGAYIGIQKTTKKKRETCMYSIRTKDKS